MNLRTTLILIAVLGVTSTAGKEPPNAQKQDQPFPISKPIHGYKYGWAIELTERSDGLLIKAQSEYERARADLEEYRTTTFFDRLPEKDRNLEIVVPDPSTKGMSIEEDITYATWDKRALLLDVFGPEAEPDKPLPVIVIVHGGGWGKGAYKIYRPFAINLAKRGFYTVAVEYRLSGEAPMPAKGCIRWVRANAEKYSFDPNAI